MEFWFWCAAVVDKMVRKILKQLSCLEIYFIYFHMLAFSFGLARDVDCKVFRHIGCSVARRNRADTFVTSPLFRRENAGKSAALIFAIALADLDHGKFDAPIATVGDHPQFAPELLAWIESPCGT
jgi:hypothetical protein